MCPAWAHSLFTNKMFTKLFVEPMKQYAGVACLVFGVLAYLIAFLHGGEKDLVYEITLQAGNVLLSGGVLGLLVTVAQNMGVFRKDLEKVLYGDEFLATGMDLEKIWMSVSKKLCKRKYPGLKENLFKTIREYFPNDRCYYEKYERNTIVVWENGVVNGRVNVIHNVEFVLKPDDGERLTHKIKVWTPVNDNLRYQSTMEEIKVGDDIVQVEEKTNNQLGDRGGVERTYELSLEGKERYKVSYRLSASYYLEDDNCVGLDAEYMIKDLRVSLTLPTELETNFINRGTLKGFENVRAGNNITTKKSKGVILPHQGYVFVITRRHNNNQQNN